MPKTNQGLLLDLPNPLPGDAHERPDLLEGHRLLIVQAEVQPKNLGLPFLQRRERVLHTVPESVVVSLVLGSGRVLVGQVVEQPVVFAGRDRSIQRSSPRREACV
jgi:hypothetical protein